MKIAVVVGSIREGRKGSQVGAWVAAAARERQDVDVEVLELADFDVPLLSTSVHPMMAQRQYESEAVRRWSRAIDEADGYVFVTPEYNHGVPGAFKNAVDSLGPEWVKKAVAFVSYGSDGGVRAVEQWRQVIANFQMLDARAAVALSGFAEFDERGVFVPAERRAGEIHALLDQLVELAGLRLAVAAR